MLKTLMKKQLTEFRSVLFKGVKSKLLMVVLSLLLLYAAVSIGFLFYFMVSTLCEPLVSAGLDWLYFALAGMMTLVMGVVGSIFTVKPQLYDARDNELLLSLPIKPSLLLLVRMLGLYVSTLLFQLIVMIPTTAVYISTVGQSWLIIVHLILLFIMPLPALVISCLIGFIIAKISSKVRHSSIIGIALLFAFIAVYFYASTQLQNYLTVLIDKSSEISIFIKTALFPLYHFGLAACGNILSLVIYALICAALFAVVYILLSKNFLTTTLAGKRSAPEKKLQLDKNIKLFASSRTDKALLRRELSHLIGSPAYMLNCCIGSVMLIIAAAAMLINRSMVSELTAEFGDLVPFALIAILVVCYITSMSILTAPSISIEGRTLWLLKSLPLNVNGILRAKVRLHLIFTLPPITIADLALIFVLRPGILMSLMIILVTVSFDFFVALLGLMMNLLMPFFNWTSEMVAVKQSLSVLFTMLISWGILILSVGLYFVSNNVLDNVLGDVGFSAICTLLYIAAAASIAVYLKRNAKRIFDSL
ncbi:MAG: hypothetical protein HFE63_09955 [Clostridiales bacterium]|nr:hypothetical protein [Clostridiales bacterium]